MGEKSWASQAKAVNRRGAEALKRKTCNKKTVNILRCVFTTKQHRHKPEGGGEIRARHKAAVTSNLLFTQINLYSLDLFKSAPRCIVLPLITFDTSWYTKRSDSRFYEKKKISRRCRKETLTRGGGGRRADFRKCVLSFINAKVIVIRTVSGARWRRGGQSQLSQRLQAALPMSSSCFIHAGHIQAARNPDQNLFWQKYLMPYLLLHPSPKWLARTREAGRQPPSAQPCWIIKSETLKEVIAQRKEKRGGKKKSEACINYLGEFVAYRRPSCHISQYGWAIQKSLASADI